MLNRNKLGWQHKKLRTKNAPCIFSAKVDPKFAALRSTISKVDSRKNRRNITCWKLREHSVGGWAFDVWVLAKPKHSSRMPPATVCVFLLTPNNGQQISISQTLMATIKCRPVLMGVNSTANNNTPVLAGFSFFPQFYEHFITV